MSNSIPGVPANMPFAAPVNIAPHVPGSQAAAAIAAPSQAEPDLKMPERPVIHFDAQEMRRNLQDAIERLNEQVQRTQQNLNFRIDEAANRFVITVKNNETGEVVRQIPDEVVLRVANNIEQLKGLLYNKKA